MALKRSALFGLIASATILLGSGISKAAVVTYTSRSSFNTAVDAAPGFTKAVETFDEFSNGTLLTTANGITYSPTNGGTALVTSDYQPLSAPNTLGLQGNGFFTNTDSIQLSFSHPIRAFGISLNTAATDDGAYQASDNLGDTASSGNDPFPGQISGQFVGFTSDTPFTSVTDGPGSISAQSYTLDDLTIASVSAVPLPGALTLLGSALAALGLLRRRAFV